MLQEPLQVKLGYLSTFENSLKTLANCYNINATKKKNKQDLYLKALPDQWIV